MSDTIIQHDNIVLCYQLSLKLAKDYQEESSHDSFNMVMANTQLIFLHEVNFFST